MTQHDIPNTWPAVLALARRASDHYSMTEAQQEVLWQAAMKHVPLDGLIVELGVCNGKTAVVLTCVARCRRALYHGIDTWGLEGSLEEVSGLLAPIQAMTRLESNTTQAAVLPTEPISLLVIDAGHDEANVKPDVERWVPCVAPGGLVAFHDYDAGPLDRSSPHWAVKYYADEATGDWKTLAGPETTGGLLIRRRPR